MQSNKYNILIKNIEVGGETVDIAIKDNLIEAVGGSPGEKADKTINGEGMAALPGLMNAHNHAAMTLFRGYGDDSPLDEWLDKKIWPAEAKLSAEDVYWGTKLACLEMIKSGTVFFSDMYWHAPAVARAAEEMGVRALVAPALIDPLVDSAQGKREYLETLKQIPSDGRVRPAFGPHAIYTLSRDNLLWTREKALETGLQIHIHLSETEKEVNDALKKYSLRPVEYLAEIDFWGPDVLAAHAIWLDTAEIAVLEKSGVKLVHCPCSNQKLASGFFPYAAFSNKQNILLGTDGAASNNNLDMLEEMKFAALQQKVINKNPQILPAAEALAMATGNCAKAMGINSGRIEAGKLADIMLVDLRHEAMVPANNLISNLVYAAGGAVVDTVICDGKVLMEKRRVEGEEEIKNKAGKIAARLFGK